MKQLLESSLKFKFFPLLNLKLELVFLSPTILIGLFTFTVPWSVVIITLTSFFDKKFKTLFNGEFIVETILNKRGKYGRVLGVLYTKDNDTKVNINETLVAEGHAVKYLG